MDKHGIYDVAVVGAGMIGSAAARHIASSKSSVRVCLIGPAEPQTRKEYLDRDVFAAYYDEGRMARRFFTNNAWAEIAKRSIDGYHRLEQESGINFYQEGAALTIMSKGSTYHKQHMQVARTSNINCEVLQKEGLSTRLPYISMAECDEGWYEPSHAGCINPRKMVKAEQVIAQRHGCVILEDVVVSVHQKGDTMTLKLRNCGELHAKKVLVATGAFTEFFDLLPIKADLALTSNTVILAECSPEDQEIMKHMPCMIYNGSGHVVDGNSYLRSYILPPIRYPDGKTYLKIGHQNIPGMFKILYNKDDVKSHYLRAITPESPAVLQKILGKIFPDFKPKSIVTDTGVTTRTASGFPYIDLIHPGLGMVIGGNGSGAKACDVFGSMAAKMMLKGQWDDDLPHQYFRFIPRNPNATLSNAEMLYAKI